MNNQSTSPSEKPVGNLHDRDYLSFLDVFDTTFSFTPDLFTTDADPDNLWHAYITGFDESERQHHNCRACRKFIEQFGGLAVIGDAGNHRSTIWDPAPITSASILYGPSFDALRRLVARSKVTGVFLTDQHMIGTPRTGAWRHLALHIPDRMQWHHALSSPAQAMAEKKQDFQQVVRALSEWPQHVIQNAVTILKSGVLARNEKVLAQAEWLLARSEEWNLTGAIKANLLWRAIATAPAGFCHPRGGMLGTLIGDLLTGRPPELVARSWAEKMDPTQYQRPQAPPAEQAIDQAEKLVERLGIARSLERRFCRVDEIQALWKPAPAAPPAGGVFDMLKQQSPAATSTWNLDNKMSWAKFSREILPRAERIELWTPPWPMSWAALVTAVHPDAPPILQWDAEGARNPVSWYVWQHGSKAEDFRIKSSAWADVEAITGCPAHWNGGKFDHHAQSAIFIIRGARETKMAGNGLFPEILKSELHGCRSVIEAFSRKSPIAGLGEPHAAGPTINPGFRQIIQLRVTVGSVQTTYQIDRWD